MRCAEGLRCRGRICLLGTRVWGGRSLPTRSSVQYMLRCLFGVEDWQEERKKEYLCHVSPHLLPRPLLKPPIIIIRLQPSDTKRAIHATRATEEPSSTVLDRPVIESGLRLADNIPYSANISQSPKEGVSYKSTKDVFRAASG